jgi:uncharacterized protein (TIGR03083 family)
VPWLELARAEREDFAAFLETLTPQQWEAPTLCDKWKVRQVAAHTISFDELSSGQLVGRFVKGLLIVDRINDVGVADYADRSPEQLVALIRGYAHPHGLTAGFGGRIALTDNMIHQQDIRRALDIPRTIPAERLLTALEFSLYAPTIRGAWRARGVRLVASDSDWSHGKGAEVRGPGEALLMAMAGRSDALKDLSGAGLDKLARRIPAGLRRYIL